MLLKIRCAEQGVVPRLVADTQDLEAVAMGRDTPAVHGWRREVFGADALRLRRGEIALTVSGNAIREIEVSGKECT